MDKHLFLAHKIIDFVNKEIDKEEFGSDEVADIFIMIGTQIAFQSAPSVEEAKEFIQDVCTRSIQALNKLNKIKKIIEEDNDD